MIITEYNTSTESNESFPYHFHHFPLNLKHISPATYVMSSLSVTYASGCFTTKAKGNSPASSSGTPVTPASLTAGWVSKIASSSAGGT